MPPARIDPEELARSIEAAWRDNAPIPRLGSVAAPDDDAYGVQEDLVGRRCSTLRTAPAGYKVSMTSEEARALVGAGEPAYGALCRADVLADGARIALSDMNAPMLEPELVFILRRDLEPGATVADIAAGCDVAPGLEVPDSRFMDWFANVGPFELIADCAVAGQLVVGSPRLPAGGIDLAAVHGEVVHDGTVVAAGNSSAVMGNPLRAVVWLRDKLASRGHALTAGMVVSSGTFTMPVPALPGRYRARYPGLGEVSVDFTP